MALEVSYIGRQRWRRVPTGGSAGRTWWWAVLAMKRVGSRATVFVNAENLSDVRLSAYQPLVRPGQVRGAVNG